MTFPTDPRLMALETVSMAAWPGLRIESLDGWRLRFGDGHTKRANSVTLLANGGADPGLRLERCEALFARAGLPPCVRMSDHADAATLTALDSAGYGTDFDATVTLWRSLADDSGGGAAADLTFGSPGESWLAAKDRINGDSAADAAARRKILARIAIPVAFAAVRGPGGDIGAVAYGAVMDGTLSLNMVATDPALRGRRLSETACRALMAWARRNHDAVSACLQVVEANAPARRLYERMGFSAPLYRYHYRLKDAADPPVPLTRD